LEAIEDTKVIIDARCIEVSARHRVKPNLNSMDPWIIDFNFGYINVL